MDIISRNIYYVLAVTIVATGSIPKGYDEGGFSASVGLESFQKDFNLTSLPALSGDHHFGMQHTNTTVDIDEGGSALASRKANITSFAVLGAAFGSLIALFLNDRLGRLRSFQLSVVIWGSGTFMQVFSSGNYGLMLFARLWGGLGAGALTVVAPLYLSEIAPARSRGMIVSIYMVMLLSFLSLGFFVNYAADLRMKPTRTQYRLVQAIPLIPVGVAFIGSFFMTDTPRWLASKDRHEEALAALARLRGREIDDPVVAREFEEIDFQMRLHNSDPAGVSMLVVCKEILTIPDYRSRFFLAMVMQTVAQWSGGNGITYYIPDIFEFAGETTSSQTLISAGAYGLVKLFFTVAFAWVLIDLIGRRRCFLTGITLQLIAHIYMAVYVSKDPEPGNNPASRAAIASVFVYAVGWSIGLCTVQYLYSTEIFPTRIRNISYASNMALHWFFQFAVVRVTPNMFVSLDVWGAYVFWAVICGLGLVVLGLWAPETKGVPLERMGELFEGHWWMGWNAKLAPIDEDTCDRVDEDEPKKWVLDFERRMT